MLQPQPVPLQEGPAAAPWIISRRAMLWWGLGLAALTTFVLMRSAVSHLSLGRDEAIAVLQQADFINYWLGARLGAEGHPANAYNRELFYSLQQAMAGPDAVFKIYSYPPVGMLLTLPLAGFSVFSALTVWTLAGGGLFVLLLSRLVDWRLAVLAPLATPAAVLNILSGQNGFFTAAILAGAIMILRERPVVAGILLGLLVYKPHIALLIPLALIAGGYWRTVFAMAACGGFLVAVSLICWGFAPWAGFFAQMDYTQQLLQSPHDDWFRRMPTVFAMVRLAGLPLSAALGSQAVTSVAAVLSLIAVWYGKASFEVKAASLPIAIFLATPYAWDYDMVLLLFSAAWLTEAGSRAGFRSWQRPVILALLALPVVMIGGGVIFSVQIAPVILWLAMAGILLLRLRPTPPHPI